MSHGIALTMFVLNFIIASDAIASTSTSLGHCVGQSIKFTQSLAAKLFIQGG